MFHSREPLEPLTKMNTDEMILTSRNVVPAILKNIERAKSSDQLFASLSSLRPTTPRNSTDQRQRSFSQSHQISSFDPTANENLKSSTGHLPQLPKLPKQSVEKVKALYPNLQAFLSQFSDKKVVFIGKGPLPVTTRSPQSSDATILVKQVRIELSVDRFLDEVRCLERLKVDSGIEITPEFLGYWVDCEANMGFIALQCIKGRTLFEFAKSNPPQEKWEEAMRSAAKQLEQLHALNIVHGDIHEYNFLIRDEQPQTFIIDFGKAYFSASIEAEKQTDLEYFEDLWGLPRSLRPVGDEGLT